MDRELRSCQPSFWEPLLVGLVALVMSVSAFSNGTDSERSRKIVNGLKESMRVSLNACTESDDLAACAAQSGIRCALYKPSSNKDFRCSTYSVVEFAPDTKSDPSYSHSCEIKFRVFYSNSSWKVGPESITCNSTG